MAQKGNLSPESEHFMNKRILDEAYARALRKASEEVKRGSDAIIEAIPERAQTR